MRGFGEEKMSHPNFQNTRNFVKRVLILVSCFALKCSKPQISITFPLIVDLNEGHHGGEDDTEI